MEKGWIWSTKHRDYYRQDYKYGIWNTTWASEQQQSDNPPSTEHNYASTRDQSYGLESVPSRSFHSPHEPAEYYDTATRKAIGVSITSHTSGLSDANDKDFETLDPSFYVRSRKFFQEGRVFAILFTEAAGAHVTSYNDSFSTVKYNENVYSQIRRFVVVKQRAEFCFACPIFTYSNRGTTKPGVRPSEHAIIYTQGHSPELLPGESGITMSPIAVRQDDLSESSRMRISSRIYFGLHHPIQYNVKVKDLGTVIDSDVPHLIAHWRGQNQEFSLSDGTELFEPQRKVPRIINDRILASKRSVELPDAINNDTAASEKIPADSLDMLSDRPISQGAQSMSLSTGPSDTAFQVSELSTVPGQLDPRYEFVTNPRAFFKKGRVFTTLWAEPRGSTDAERVHEETTEQAFIEIRRFVVVRPRPTHCLCLAISTYSGRGTTKLGIAAEDHAAVVPVDGEMRLHPEEQQLTKAPLFIKVEEPGVSVDPMSRLNFGKIYTVEYNVKVRRVGRIVSDSMRLLEEYFVQSLKL